MNEYEVASAALNYVGQALRLGCEQLIGQPSDSGRVEQAVGRQLSQMVETGLLQGFNCSTEFDPKTQSFLVSANIWPVGALEWCAIEVDLCGDYNPDELLPCDPEAEFFGTDWPDLPTN